MIYSAVALTPNLATEGRPPISSTFVVFIARFDWRMVYIWCLHQKQYSTVNPPARPSEGTYHPFLVMLGTTSLSVSGFNSTHKKGWKTKRNICIVPLCLDTNLQDTNLGGPWGGGVSWVMRSNFRMICCDLVGQKPKTTCVALSRLVPTWSTSPNTEERAKELFGELVYDGIFVDAIHADRTKQQRDNTVTWLLQLLDDYRDYGDR